MHACMRVWLTTNGVVVRHQVPSPVDGDRGQTHVSWSTVSMYSMHPSGQENGVLSKYMLLSCVRTSYQIQNSECFPTKVTQ